MSRADFIEETTVSIAGTNGDGAATLTQVTGLPRFSHAFGVSARMVDYVIEDIVGLRFEKGYGVIAANVLTRSNVHETWDGATYVSVNAAALQFGSSPTSGNIRIRLAPTGDQFVPIPPAFNTTVGGNSNYPSGYQVTGHIQTSSSAVASGALVADREYYSAFLLLSRGKLDGFSLTVNTIGTSGIKAALYEVGPDGLPGPCITQFNPIANTATGQKTDTGTATWSVNTGPIRLSPGWFYVGIIQGDSTGQITRWSGVGQIAVPPSFATGGYGYALGMYAAGNYAAGLPTVTPARSYTIWTPGTAPNVAILALKVNNA